MAKYFNKNLKYIRSLRGMSQQELADKLNIDRSTISRWENEDMDATVDNAIQVATILNIPVPDFLGKDLSNQEIKPLDELDVLFSKHKDILTDEDKEYMRFIIEKRKKEIDKQLGEE